MFWWHGNNMYVSTHSMSELALSFDNECSVIYEMGTPFMHVDFGWHEPHEPSNTIYEIHSIQPKSNNRN